MSLSPAQPSPLSPDAGSPRRTFWRTTLLLTGAIFGLLLLDNATYLFATRLYENTDHASDSLMVREAKSTFLLHGHYSQWHFYHPGPALLDTLAAGEALFYDGLHLVPTPYNGQLLALGLVLALFFSLALAIFARQFDGDAAARRFLLPLALLFAAWHYGAVGGQVFLDAWPAYPLIVTFLCFVVAAAAVASGDGRILPVLVLTGGWLVHNHVAQPLFVVPLTLLAYAGLLAACRRQAGASGKGVAGTLTGGWRAFPRAHAAAAGLLALFILPLLLDALHGRASNLQRILEYAQAHRAPSKKLVRSLSYFLTFGGHDPTQLGTEVFGRYGAGSLWEFVERHGFAYAFWGVALVGAPGLFLWAKRRRETEEAAGVGSRQRRFLRWFYAVLASAWGLTLAWGMRQDGAMYYYNAYFNYSIYYGLALGLAAALAVALAAWTDSPARRGRRPLVVALLWGGVAVMAVAQAPRFRVSAFGTPVDEVMARTVDSAAAALPKDAVCFVDCQPWEQWPCAIAVVLELERLGYRARVNDNSEIIFGHLNTIQRETIRTATPLARWRIVPQDPSGPRPDQPPLLPGSALDILSLPNLNPADKDHVVFSKTGNFDDFAVFGWAPTDLDWTWSDERTALLAFYPLNLSDGAEGVDLVIAAWSFQPTSQSAPQRVVIQFNDETLGTFPLPPTPDQPALRVRISAAQWQEARTHAEARVQFHFPDARSPHDYGLSDDHRPLGGGFRSIEFQEALPPARATPAPAAAAFPAREGHS